GKSAPANGCQQNKDGKCSQQRRSFQKLHMGSKVCRTADNASFIVQSGARFVTLRSPSLLFHRAALTKALHIDQNANMGDLS
ncbi:MAG: hypothetical protein ACOYL7_18795, partial [Caldilinea sp.]